MLIMILLLVILAITFMVLRKYEKISMLKDRGIKFGTNTDINCVDETLTTTLPATIGRDFVTTIQTIKSDKWWLLYPSIKVAYLPNNFRNMSQDAQIYSYYKAAAMFKQHKEEVENLDEAREIDAYIKERSIRLVDYLKADDNEDYDFLSESEMHKRIKKINKEKFITVVPEKELNLKTKLASTWKL